MLICCEKLKHPKYILIVRMDLPCIIYKHDDIDIPCNLYCFSMWSHIIPKQSVTLSVLLMHCVNKGIEIKKSDEASLHIILDGVSQIVKYLFIENGEGSLPSLYYYLFVNTTRALLSNDDDIEQDVYSLLSYLIVRVAEVIKDNRKLILTIETYLDLVELLTWISSKLFHLKDMQNCSINFIFENILEPCWNIFGDSIDVIHIMCSCSKVLSRIVLTDDFKLFVNLEWAEYTATRPRNSKIALDYLGNNILSSLDIFPSIFLYHQLTRFMIARDGFSVHFLLTQMWTLLGRNRVQMLRALIFASLFSAYCFIIECQKTSKDERFSEILRSILSSPIPIDVLLSGCCINITTCSDIDIRTSYFNTLTEFNADIILGLSVWKQLDYSEQIKNWFCLLCNAGMQFAAEVFVVLKSSSLKYQNSLIYRKVLIELNHILNLKSRNPSASNNYSLMEIPFDDSISQETVDLNRGSNEKKRKLDDILIQFKKMDKLEAGKMFHEIRRIENEILLIPEAQIFDVVRNYIGSFKWYNNFPLIMALNLLACRRNKSGAYILSMISLQDGPAHFLNSNILIQCLRDWATFDTEMIEPSAIYKHLVESIIDFQFPLNNIELGSKNIIEVEFLLKIELCDGMLVPNIISRMVYAINYTFQRVSCSELNSYLFLVNKVEIYDVLGHYSFSFALPILIYVFKWSFENLIMTHDSNNFIPLARLAASCIELSLLLDCDVQCDFLVESFGVAQYLMCVKNLCRLRGSQFSLVLGVILHLYDSGLRCIEIQNNMEPLLSESFFFTVVLLSSVIGLLDYFSNKSVSVDYSPMLKLCSGYIKQKISVISMNTGVKGSASNNNVDIILAWRDDFSCTWQCGLISFDDKSVVEWEIDRSICFDLSLAQNVFEFFCINGIIFLPSIFKLLPQICDIDNCNHSNKLCSSFYDFFCAKLLLLCERWFLPIIYRNDRRFFLCEISEMYIKICSSDICGQCFNKSTKLTIEHIFIQMSKQSVSDVRLFRGSSLRNWFFMVIIRVFFQNNNRTNWIQNRDFLLSLSLLMRVYIAHPISDPSCQCDGDNFSDYLAQALEALEWIINGIFSYDMTPCETESTAESIQTQVLIMYSELCDEFVRFFNSLLCTELFHEIWETETVNAGTSFKNIKLIRYYRDSIKRNRAKLNSCLPKIYPYFISWSWEQNTIKILFCESSMDTRSPLTDGKQIKDEPKYSQMAEILPIFKKALDTPHKSEFNDPVLHSYDEIIAPPPALIPKALISTAPSEEKFVVINPNVINPKNDSNIFKNTSIDMSEINKKFKINR